MQKKIEFPPAFVQNCFLEGQKILSDKIRLLVLSDAPHLFDYIDDQDYESFLEPYLFSYFAYSKDSLSIEQIFFKKLITAHQNLSIKVYANINGIVELPGVGYLHTTASDVLVDLKYFASSNTFLLENDGRSIDFSIELPFFVEGTSIEVALYDNPLLSHFFDAKTDCEKHGISFLGKENIHAINKAFNLIRHHLPDYFDQLNAGIKRIIVYKRSGPNSFAALGCHGNIYLNAPDYCTELFFSEDIIHQGGHVLFNSISESEKILNISPDTPLSMLLGDEGERRSVFEVLHGVYTESWMNSFWDSYYNENEKDLDRKAEMMGRFTYILTRFGYDLKSLAFNDLYSKKGMELFNWFFNVYSHIVHSKYEQLSKYSISDQPYCFDHALFKRNNLLLLQS